MADKKINFDAQVSIDQPLVRVPVELLQKSLRSTRKVLDKDFNYILQSINTDGTQINTQDLLNKATILKRKLEESIKEEQMISKRLKARIEHLEQLSKLDSLESEGFEQWSRLRVFRIIVDYLLRNGYNQTAKALASGIPGLNNLVDVELFEANLAVESALKRRSCSECLAWCLENRAALKKIKSPLEFMLRSQEFIELLKKGKKMDAIQYAKKYLNGFTDNLAQLQETMALLAFSPTTKCNKYKFYFSDEKWNQLARQFRTDSYQLYSLPTQPLLSIVLQAGLPALKTPTCYKEEDKNVHCPVCTYPLNDLARPLPFSHHVNSTIVCRISGAVMDENNPPMILPNGNVYSLNSLERMMKERASILDPRSGEKFTLSQCKKAFLA